MTDFLNVQPLRTFDFDGELKTRKSKPFHSEKSRARQLETKGYVSVVNDDEAPKQTKGAKDGGKDK